MATFKVGQRVRIIAHIPRPPMREFHGEPFIGREATIVGRASMAGEDWLIEVTGDRRIFMALQAELAPLTDPKADRFIETVKSWGPLKKETANVR